MRNLKTSRLEWDNLKLDLNLLATSEPDMLWLAIEFNSFSFEPQIRYIDINEQVIFHPKLNSDWLATKDLSNLLFGQDLSLQFSVRIIDFTFNNLVYR